MSASDELDNWKRAFEEIQVSPGSAHEEKIKMAKCHLNLMETSGEVAHVLEKFASSGGGSFSASRNELDAAGAYFCLRGVVDCQKVYTFKKADVFFKQAQEDDYKGLTDQLRPGSHIPGVVDEFKAIWERWKADNWTVWVFGNEVTAWTPSDGILNSILAELGLFGFGPVTPGSLILLIECEAMDGFKPSVADACFNFYFDAHGGVPDHGLTLSLVDGRVGKKEWIARKRSLAVTNVWALRAIDDIILDSAPDAYWARLLDRVRGA